VTHTYDTIVAGVGGMGSAALAAVATRGARVLGIERFAPVHDRGASSGRSRAIRRAYFENAAYVPLLERSYELWRALERDTGREVLHALGLVTAGRAGSEVVENARLAAERHRITVELWDARDLRTRYPSLRPEPDETAVFEPEGGFVVPEAAIAAHLSLAISRGAEARFGTSVRRWRSEAAGVVVELDGGEELRCARLILTLGPWFEATLAELGVALRVQRNVQVWFEPAGPRFGGADFPTFLLDRRGLPAMLYGFPDVGDGVKAAFHGLGPVAAADELDRRIDAARDVLPVAAALEGWAPGAAATLRHAHACMYALTPDGDFVVDRHPHDPRVVLCGGFSGHGFKFASAIGEIAADLAFDGASRHEIGFLSLRRFAARDVETPRSN
jgi:sarcosine oxidase